MKSGNPKLFRDLDLSWIKNAVVILDIDGTLLADNKLVGGEAPSTIDAIDGATLAKVRELGGRNQVYLVSNGKDHGRRERIAAQIGNVKYHPTDFYKPNPKSVRGILPQDERAVFVIGDKLLTDGLLALRIDAPFIQVGSLRMQKESLLVSAAYRIDNWTQSFLNLLIPRIHEDSALIILTERPYSITHVSDILYRFVKKLSKAIFYRKAYLHGSEGPAAVLRSLLRGLSELNKSFKVNPWKQQITGTVCVLENEQALRFALERKKKGFIKKIIAGPNIAVTPNEYDGVMKNSAIDKIVLPSSWSRDWWISFDQMFASRAIVWDSGVAECEGRRDPNGICVVYAKNPNEKLFNKIIEILWSHKLPIVVSRYGSFKEHEYLRLLRKARMMVYLSEAESQGNALYQAWMSDIPTLIWNRGFIEYKGGRFESSLVGAPSLDPLCGLSFKGEEDFEQKIIELNERYNFFKPREFARAHHTDILAARRYLEIAENS